MDTLDTDQSHNIPPGWDYNPATWRQRLPIVAMALIGTAIATYLALWQYRVIDTVWEPFFGDGSEIILDSELSRILSGIGISDAALGALAYLSDAVFGLIGGKSRWRTMPWIVIVFAILVGPLGLVSLGLVIAQPVLYDAWCTLCLASAVISVLMIGPAMDEALASLQYIRRVHRTGERSAWRAFWGLESGTGGTPVPLAPWDETLNMWSQAINAILGVWLMAAPAVLGYGGVAADSDHIAGPFIAAFATISLWQVTRNVRWANAPFAIWLLIAPFALGYPVDAAINSIAVGIIVGALCFVRGRITRRYGGGWAALFNSKPIQPGTTP